MKKSESLPSPKIPDLGDLPPGFRRPTRLSFTFLPGDSDSSPICGWFVLNRLDDNILVFSASGSSLGSIDTDGRRRPPSSSPSPEPPMIDNAVLRGLVSDILKRGKSYGERFRSICAAALETLEASPSAQQATLPVLIERPMAIIRARIGFEHAGLPPDEHIWSADHGKKPSPNSPAQASDHAGQNATIPVRLGAPQERNGGLIGFWVEDANGLNSGNFHVAAGADDDQQDRQSGKANDAIRSFLEGTTNICLASPDADIVLAMLIDPRGEIQATSSMTPATSLALPTEHFIDPLRAMEILFHAAPILTDPDEPNLPLPEDQGGEWSWTARSGDEAGWRQLAPDNKTELGKVGLVEGWLRLIRRDR